MQVRHLTLGHVLERSPEHLGDALYRNPHHHRPLPLRHHRLYVFVNGLRIIGSESIIGT